MSFLEAPLPLWKLHGARNDFLLCESDPDVHFASLAALRSFAVEVCNRTSGLGADGLVFVRRTVTSASSRDVEVLVVNSDGSLAGTCGNALRCVGLHAHARLGWSDTPTNPLTPLLPLTVQRWIPALLTGTGSPDAQLADDEGELRLPGPFARLLALRPTSEGSAEVDVVMGHVRSRRRVELPSDVVLTLSSLVPAVAWSAVRTHFVELANPHVVFVGEGLETLTTEDYRTVGLLAQQELPSRVPGVCRSNIGFVSLRMRGNAYPLTVYERGAGLTQCCGSGAMAARAALEAEGFTQTQEPWCHFAMPGGLVSIGSVEETGERVLRGPASFVGSLLAAKAFLT